MRRLAPAIAVLLLLLARPVAATERVDLPNGLTVILAPQRGAPVVAVGAFVRVGRVDEPPALAGATHFVEHMMFRATGGRPHGDSERETWSTGARMGAQTREDFTRYLVTVPSDRLSLALDVLSDALTSAAFRPDEVEEERKVVLAEIEKRATNPDTRAWEDSTALAFLPHPYGERIIGSRESIGRMSRDALYGWFRARYRPDRTVLVVVGDFERDAALAGIRRGFGEWASVGPPPPPPPALPSETGGYQEAVIRVTGASPALYLTAPMPAYLDPDYLPARFLTETLSGWVRERIVAGGGPALATDVFFSSFFGGNLLRVRVTLVDPRSAGRARDGLLGLLADLRDPAFAHRTLPELRENFAAREQLLKEDLPAYAEVLGRAALAGYYDPPGPPAHLAAPDRYDRIGPEDLTRVAQRFLAPGNVRVLFRLPEDAPLPDPLKPAAIAGPGRRPPPSTEVRRLDGPPEDERPAGRSSPRNDGEAVVTELASGLKLVHLEDDSLPVVAISLVFPGGSSADPPGREGTALVGITALPRATTGFEDSDLRWRLFSMGNDYRFAVDPDATRMTITVPRDRLEEALQTVSTMLRAPAFTEQAVEEARGRILRRVRRADESVGSFAGIRFRAALLEGTPYAHEPFGTAESLARITRADLTEWHRTALRLDHAWLALTGDISPRRARSLVQATFGGERRETPSPAPEPPPAADPSLPERRIEYRHASGRTYVIVGARTPSRFAPENAALTLLQQILGWRVFHEFTDVRSTAYEAGAFHDSFAGAGAFGLYVGARDGEAEDVAAWLEGEIAAIRDGGPDPELLEDARRAWLGGADLASQRLASVAARLAWRGAVGGDPTSYEALRREILALGAADVERVASRVLAEDRIRVLLVR